MSIRTLVEINHDKIFMIEQRPDDFADDLLRYLSSGSKEAGEQLEKYGVRVIGLRHHSDIYEIEWGAVKDTNKGQKG